MKRTRVILAAFVTAQAFLGCGDDGTAAWLADVSNLIIGKWQSEIPSMGNAKAPPRAFSIILISRRLFAASDSFSAE